MRDYKQILIERIRVREQAKTDLVFRRDVLQRCSEDTLFWFDNFAWALDPRRSPSELPLIPYDGRQVEYLKFLEGVLKNPRDIFIDKPRDVGATVLTMNFLLKHFLFDSTFNARIGSRKEDYVDHAGDPDTLFYKIDYTLARLPNWMKPEGFDDKKHRAHMRLESPTTSNTITGESANVNFGRGGRQTMVLYDEFGFWPWARSAWESAGDVTNIRVAMTTPPDTGRSSHAYKLISGQAGQVEKFAFEFSDIPWKDDKWLNEQRTRRSTEEFEREVQKSYAGTTVGKVYAEEWNAHVTESTDIDYKPELPLFVSWDFGLDAFALIWWQKDYKTDKVYIIDSYTNSNKTADFYVPFITGEIVSGIHEYSADDLAKIDLHKNWRKDITHYGDPDVAKRNLITGTSTRQELMNKGIYVQSKNWEGKTHRDMREKARLLMRRLSVNSTRNTHMIECILEARYPQRSEGSQSTSEIDKPIHDWTSHFRTSFEYFADNEPNLVKKLKDLKPVAPAYHPHGGY